MKKRINVNYYINALNDIAQATEEMGNSLNDHYEVMEKAITASDFSIVSDDEFTTTKEKFVEGTASYQENLSKLDDLQVPIPVLGKHKKLISGYRTFVEGCDEMTSSINVEKHLVEVDAFKASEEKQDQGMTQTTDMMQRIMQQILG